MQSVGSESGSELTQGKAMPVACDVSSLLGAVSKLLDTGVDVCVATVIESHGSGPSTPGQKMLLGSNGVALGTVGGGAIERDAVAQMRRCWASPKLGRRFTAMRSRRISRWRAAEVSKCFSSRCVRELGCCSWEPGTLG